MGITLFQIAVGIVIGALGFWYIIQKQDHSDNPKAAADIVNWDYLEEPKGEGIIRLKDGGLLATYTYKGKDLHGANPEHRDQLSKQLNAFFMQFEDGYGFYFSTMRREAMEYPGEGHFPDPVTYSIDQERRQKHNSEDQFFRSRFYLSILWKPGYKAEIDDFLSVLEDIENNIDRMLYPDRLNGQEHMEFLYESMHGISQPITVPREQQTISNILANKQIQILPFYDKRKNPIKARLGVPSENKLIDGDQFIQTITVTGFPNSTFNGILNRLNHLKCKYRWTTRIYTLSREEQEKKIKKKRNTYRMGRKGPTEILSSSMSDESNKDKDVEEAFKDQHSLSKMKDSSDALSDLHGRKKAFAITTSTITVMSEDHDRLKDSISAVMKALRSAGFTGNTETYQSFDAWIGSLPGQSQNIRRIPISTYNIADILPTWSMWSGREDNPSKFMQGAEAHFQAKTIRNEPFNKHRPASGDVGHSFIIGSTGGGKSTYLNFEIAQWLRHKNSQVFLFDKGYSGELLCKAAGGQHYNVFGDNSLHFQPLRDLTKKSLKNSAFYSEWVQDLFELQNVPLDSSDQHIIQNGLQKLAEQPTRERTLTQLTFYIQDRRLKETLRIYTRDGTYGNILDASNTEIHGNRYQVFELGNLLDHTDKIVLPILRHLFHKVEQALDQTKPTFIVIEEAWGAFANEHFQNRLKNWLATLRKHNGHVCLVAHSAEQIHSLHEPTMFLNNAPERVFLPDPGITREEVKKNYRIYGLTEAQMDIISTLEEKRQYYLSTPAGSGAIDLDLLPLSLGFIGNPSKLSVSQRRDKIEELRAEHGQRWPVEWLNFIGLSKEAKELDKNYNSFEPKKKKEVAL